MNDRVKAGLIALATIVGAFTAVAQFLDYLTSAKVDLLLSAGAISASAVPIAIIVVAWLRDSATPGSTFSWNLFRTTAAICAVVGLVGITASSIAVIGGASTRPPEEPSTTAAPTTAVALPPSPPQTTCPPAGQADATQATVVRLQPPDFPLLVDSAYYKAKLSGKIQLELGGQLAGQIPAGKELFLIGWADPTTVDSTPDHNPGDGLYYRLSTFRVSGSCFLRPQRETGYDGANGLTFRYFFVLVDAAAVADFMSDEYKNGYNDQVLDSLGVVRVAYFDVPTANL